MTDTNWAQFDFLVECYSAAKMFLDRFQPLQDELSACCARIAKSKVTIDDFANVLSAYGTDSEPIPRKLAWCAQHVFPARAWGVGSRVIRERKGHLDSPLVGQIARLDDDLVLADQPKIHSVLQRLAAWGEEIGCIPQTKIDAVLISPGVARQAYIVKGCSYDQARQISPTLQINGAIESLWGRDDRLLVNANAPREAVAALLQAREVISQCVPGYTVTPIYMIIDNVEYGWEFQCYDFSSAKLEVLEDRRIALDDLPVLKSSNDYREELRRDPDLFSGLPAWCGSEPLRCSPVDRATRVLMLLELLWREQHKSRDQLVFVSASTLGAAVQEEYHVDYPIDQRRHDIEDFLQGGGYIRRSWSTENAYAITPKGIARLFMVKRKFAEGTSVNVNLNVMAYINLLSELWWKHHNTLLKVPGM